MHEKVSAGVQSLKEIFERARADISNQGIKVEHGGKVVRLINNIVKFGFVPVSISEDGEHFSKHGRTYVYHINKMSLDTLVTIQIHEKAHGYAYNQFTEDVVIENNTNGFARLAFNKVEPAKTINTFHRFNEGFTEYLARKALSGSVDYATIPTRAYDPEVELVEDFIGSVSEISGHSVEEIEIQLVQAYNSPHGGDSLQSMVTTYCGPYAHVLLDTPEIQFFKAFSAYKKGSVSDQKIEIDVYYLTAEHIDPKEFVKEYPFTRIIQKSIDDTGEKNITTVVAE